MIGGEPPVNVRTKSLHRMSDFFGVVINLCNGCVSIGS